MPIPIPKGKNITVERKTFPPSYDMPSHSMATDHYSIIYVISGERRAVSFEESFTYHSGNAVLTPPFKYNRTLSDGNVVYERYLIKFRPEFAEPFIKNVGRVIFDKLYEENVFDFEEDMQPVVMAMFEDMLKEYEKDTPYKEFILQGMLSRLLAFIWENSRESKTVSHNTVISKTIVDVMRYMEENYNKDIGLKSAAEKLHFSQGHLSRLFSAEVGMSFSEYLINIRIRNAEYLLVKSDKSITSIAYETGYNRSDHFSAQFKSKVGITPTEFRKSAGHSKDARI